MSHTHSEDRTSYYLEQLCAIGFCGMLGGVAIMLYQQNLLEFILAKKLHVYVLSSGVAIVALVTLRAMFLWRSVGQTQPTHTHEPEHEHEHCDDHGHDHGHDPHHDHEQDCDHYHGPEHSHSHVHVQGHSHSHGDGHGHDHSWKPWRYIVLLFPVVLYFIVPNGGLSPSMASINPTEFGSGVAGKLVANTGMRLSKAATDEPLQIVAITRDGPAEKAGLRVEDVIRQIIRTADSEGKPLATPELILAKDLSLDDAVAKLAGPPGSNVGLTVDRKDGDPLTTEITRRADIIGLDFKELERASYTADTRSYYKGKIGRITGQFVPGRNDKMFSLARFKITCCAPDAIQLNVIIMLDRNSSGSVGHVKDKQWVQVTGEIDFLKKLNRDEYIAALIVASPDDIKQTEPDSNPYIQ